MSPQHDYQPGGVFDLVSSNYNNNGKESHNWLFVSEHGGLFWLLIIL